MSKPGGQRPSDDNVIYANFGARTRVNSAEETGPAVASAVEAVAARNNMSPAAQRVLNSAASQTDAGRVRRGREYADGGHVVDIRISFGRAEAEVVGSQNEPFHTTMVLPPRTQAELHGTVQELAGVSGSAKRAYSGDLPEDALDVLLAPGADDFRFYCDCPDPAPVCKHAVALAEVMAKRIDADPNLVFALRNLTVAAIEQSMRAGAHTRAQENAREGSPYFWAGRELPELPRPKVAPMIDDSDTDLLRHAMEPVSFTNIDLLNAVADIEDLYDIMTEEESGRRP